MLYLRMFSLISDNTSSCFCVVDALCLPPHAPPTGEVDMFGKGELGFLANFKLNAQGDELNPVLG